ncbi:MAG: hypothetical protein NCA08_08595 [Deltaproteobacteria bacterium]|nr:hypothetical protein [Candidatus Deferrimicrobium borealis]
MQASSNSPLLRKFHLCGLCLNAAVLLVGLKGLDLGSLVAPLLLATGIVSGFLAIACYRESLFVRINACLFFLFLGIAFLVGKSQPTQAVRLAACLCFLLLIKYNFPVKGFSRRFFQFFLGGYVLSTMVGLMAVVGLWEPSDFFLPVYQTSGCGLYNAPPWDRFRRFAIWFWKMVPEDDAPHWMVMLLSVTVCSSFWKPPLVWMGSRGGVATSSSTLPGGTSRGHIACRTAICSCW